MSGCGFPAIFKEYVGTKDIQKKKSGVKNGRRNDSL